MKKRWLASIAAAGVLAGSYALAQQSSSQENGKVAAVSEARLQRTGNEAPASDGQLPVEHAECAFFGAGSERFQPRTPGAESPRGLLTREFSAMSAVAEDHGTHERPFARAAAGSANLIDQYIYADLQSNGITPANKTSDYEFIRRVYLDATGRIPGVNDLTIWIASTDPNKRATLIDRLLSSTAWVDKWTMYYGDLFGNTASTVQVNRRAEGRNAFYKWIHDSIANGKPYNQMATELIAAQGNNSFDQSNGQINWLAGWVVNGGPVQDIFDSQAAAVADTFLGITHVNCLLCHSGRGHLDTLSLWGSQQTRTQAWGLASFLSHTNTTRVNTPPDPNNKNSVVQYWSLNKYTTDYALNTTTGNRPARQPIGTMKTVSPAYLWGGRTPNSGQDYREALANFVTSDFQFARAAVNYIWAQYFGRGIVDPPDQFDPLRLDPKNPPPAPWTLQPSNPALLNALAQYFIDNNYDIKAIHRLILNSDTYQLSSHYDVGTWNAAWEPYFARKFVRRMWPEELHDSVFTATNMTMLYTVSGFSTDSTVYGVTSPGFGKITFAMQAPDVVNMPDNGGSVSQFLDTFLRGNRDDQPRKTEGSILQTLGLMNDNFINSRIHSTPSTSFLLTLLKLPDDQLVDQMYLSVLSRHPSASEMTIARNYLVSGTGTNVHTTNAEDLLWSLFNKVDFVFNY